MNRHPPSTYGDEPPAYMDHEASSYLDDHDPHAAGPRQNGATMRLLPTSGEDYGDLTERAPSPSHYDPDLDMSQ